MKKNIIYILISLLHINTSCEEFVEIDSPNFQIINENIYSNEKTAVAAMQGIYNQLRPAFFTEASSTHMGMSGNLVEPRLIANSYNPFHTHEINTIESPDATNNLEIWSSAYNIIYLTNSFLEGIKNSTALSINLRNSLEGQALVIRAFTYFYLTNFYGNVPLLLGTDYKENSIASQTAKEEVWSKIKSDLEDATILLNYNKIYPEGERFYITRNVAIALLARVCLYREDWINAEKYSSQILADISNYEILDDLDKVFLKNNRESIWQIDPMGGSPRAIYTAEAKAYVIRPFILGSISGQIVLNQSFLEKFSSYDKRRTQWVGVFEKSNETYHYINKYKEYTSNINNTESSVVLRLAEQYLIRSEARLHQGKLDLAIKDIDVIRKRAGLELIANKYPEIKQQTLLDTIMEERKRELFGEYGHHWLDLKRTGSVFKKFEDSPTWQDTDIWYPIPEKERLSNPNLGQNEGY